MEIVRSNRTGATVIALSGKFDVMEAPHFEPVVKDMTRDRPRVLGLDLTDVPYVDSSGIGGLIKAMQAVKAYGGEMILFGVVDSVRQVFKIAGLEKFFRIITADEFNRKYPP